MGIDAAYSTMDTEEGVEVGWNEVCFSERENFKPQEEKIPQVFYNLIKLEHPNIVKFHKYWIDSRDDKPRVYMGKWLILPFRNNQLNIKRISGDIHHRVHVVWIFETIFEAAKTQCKKAST